MGNDHMGHLPVDRMTDRQTDMTENFTSPQLRWWAGIKTLEKLFGHSSADELKIEFTHKTTGKGSNFLHNFYTMYCIN